MICVLSTLLLVKKAQSDQYTLPGADCYEELRDSLSYLGKQTVL